MTPDVGKPIGPNWPLFAAMRFVLAAHVMLCHADGYLHFLPKWVWNFDPFAAVVAFLLLSGYSICHSYTHETEGYFMRRVRRIYPTLLASLGIGCAAVAVGAFTTNPDTFVPMPPSVREILGHLFLVNGFLTRNADVYGPAWTLSLEWWCYMAAPLVALFTRRAWIIAGFVVAGAAIYAARVEHAQYFHAQITICSYIALSGFWLMGWLYYQYPEHAASQIAILTIPSLLVHLFTPNHGDWASVTTIVSAVALVYQRELKVPQKWTRLAVYGGDLSYPLYLVHVPAIMLYMALGGTNPFFGLVIILILTLMTLHFVERPLRKRKPQTFNRNLPLTDSGNTLPTA